MIFLKSVAPLRLVKKSLLALTAASLIISGVDTAQASIDSSISSGNGKSLELEAAVADVTSSSPASQPIAAPSVLADGTYLFSESPSPDVMGSTYAIVSVQNNQTIGAFYQPRSSFDCFSGEVLPDRLAIDIVDSYEGTVYPYSIALTVDESLTAGHAAGAYTLEGFYRLDTLSEQDREILAICQADLSQ
ncbi:MAG: hypothetical protein WBB01_17465 [Phormidesmis sp.]